MWAWPPSQRRLPPLPSPLADQCGPPNLQTQRLISQKGVPSNKSNNDVGHSKKHNNNDHVDSSSFGAKYGWTVGHASSWDSWVSCCQFFQSTFWVQRMRVIGWLRKPHLQSHKEPPKANCEDPHRRIIGRKAGGKLDFSEANQQTSYNWNNMKQRSHTHTEMFLFHVSRSVSSHACLQNAHLPSRLLGWQVKSITMWLSTTWNCLSH